jgi:DNA-directed RNA polymerase specialized sigma24 family protein
MSAKQKPILAPTAAFHEHADALFRYCYYRVHDRQVALQLAENALRQGFEHGGQDMEVYLYQQARVMIDAVPYARKADIDLGEPGSRFLALMEFLEKKYHDIVILRHINELPISRIAGILQIHELQVQADLSLAYEKMKEAVARLNASLPVSAEA